MHLNVPPRGETTIGFWMRNIRWALLGVFGPELVVFIAWKQYLSAKALVRRSLVELVERTEKTQEQSILAPTKSPSFYLDLPSHWTMVHGFYAGMGGFTFPLSKLTTDMTKPGFRSDCRRLTLTARGVALLADCNLLPNFEKGYLNDKSKSDGLSKLIACVQAAWLIVQVFGRLALGLQVTLLEINTIGHVLCALIIYLLWWHKPRMVLEPIVLEGDWVGPLCAYMYMSSRTSGQTTKAPHRLTSPIVNAEMSSLAFFPSKLSGHPTMTVIECRNDITSEASTEIPPVAENPSKPSTVTGSSFGEETTFHGFFGSRPVSSAIEKPMRDDLENAKYSEESQGLGTDQSIRWSLAAEAVYRYPAIKRRFTPHTHISNGRSTSYLQETQPEELVEEHCSNWSTEGLLPGDKGLIMGMALWFASMAFGGIHAAAWYDYFPSKAEAWLWQCSAIYIAWSGLIWLLINLVAQMSQRFDGYWNRIRSPEPPFARSRAIVGVSFFCGALYAFARIYLVVEAFVSIRKLPVSAYETPDWTQVIPHL